MTKRAPLSGGVAGLASLKPVATAPVPAESETRGVGRPKSLPEGIRSYTLRLPEEVLRQLNILAAQEGITARTILLAGLNSEFAKRRLPPIAE